MERKEKASKLVPQKLEQPEPYKKAPCMTRQRWRYCTADQSADLWAKTILLASKICTS